MRGLVQPSPVNALEKITVTETIYHQVVGEGPTSYPTTFFRVLNFTAEQVWTREQKVGKDWTMIDLGWLKDKPVSLMVIRNEEGFKNVTLPTEDMKPNSTTPILELGVGNTEAQPVRMSIYPGESQRITPQPGFNWFVRCSNGPAKFHVIAFPG